MLLWRILMNEDNNTPSNDIQFRSVPIDPNKRGIKDKLSMVQNFATALASRSINNKKINTPIKQLRVLSCFGNQNSGGVLPPCEHLKESEVSEGKHYCGACGCGDKKMTWLVQKSDNYSKLDYPKVACPLQMPGFSNYVISTPDESEEPITRKYYIENVNYKEIQNLPVKIGIQKTEQESPSDSEQKTKSDS